VISEDVSPYRRTRLQLCEDSAAKALGSTLKADLEKCGRLSHGVLDEVPSIKGHAYKEVHEALCALANILDPLQDVSGHCSLREESLLKEPQVILAKASLERANSGGIESLLLIARLPFLVSSKPISFQQSNMELVEEACRSLALMSPLLLSKKLIPEGFSKWSLDLLMALHHVLRQIVSIESADQICGRAVDLYVNVLQGISALARSEPLKVQIVDKSLPLLLQAKSVGDPIDVSNAAAQVLQSLDFAEDEIAVQVAGNNPNALADWFCLQRSLLLQAMARAEIRHIIADIWTKPFQLTSQGELTRLIRDNHLPEERTCLFENFADDHFTQQVRESLVKPIQ
jgi:hypothetical protein